MQKTVSAELHAALLKYADQVKLPPGHACLFTVDQEDCCSGRGDSGVRGRAIEQARELKQSGDYARVLLVFQHELDAELTLYEYDGAVIVVAVERDWVPFVAPGLRGRCSPLADRMLEPILA